MMSKRKSSVEFEKEFRESFGIKDNIVYHYCSLDALYGILSSKSFWLTSLNSSNDKKELAVSKRILDEVLERMIIEESSASDREFYVNVLKASHENKHLFNKYIHYYALSCVGEKDSLVHWDRYGKMGEGVCIGINLAILDNFMEMKYGLIKFRTWLSYGNIIYDKSLQEEHVKEKIAGMIGEKMCILKQVPDIETIFYYTILNSIKPLFKDEGFMSEKEYRIILEEETGEREADYYIKTGKKNGIDAMESTGENIKRCLKDFNILTSDKKFGLFESGIRGYYALNLKELWSDTLIPEIVIGPKCYQNKRELKDFLRFCGMERTKVAVSNIPVR